MTDLEKPKARGDRARWMGTEGAQFFAELMLAIAQNAGTNPLRARADQLSESPRGGLLSIESLVDFDKPGAGSRGGLDTEILQYVLYGALLEAAKLPSRRLHGATPYESFLAMQDHMRKYTDVAVYSNDEPLLSVFGDTLVFAVQATFVSAELALNNHPSANEPMDESKWMRRLQHTIRDRALLTGVIEPLAATGFGVLGDAFVIDSTNFVQANAVAHINVPQEQRTVIWLDNPRRPSLHPTFVKELRRRMAADGRDGYETSRSVALDDETSSGCPARHYRDIPDVGVTSGLAIIQAICADAVDEVVAARNDLARPIDGTLS